MNLTQLIESRKKVVREKFALNVRVNNQEDFDKGEILKLVWEEKILDDIIANDSESIRLAYLAGLQRSKELLPKKRLEAKGQMEPEDYYENGGYNSAVRKTLSNIEDEIKSLDTN